MAAVRRVLFLCLVQVRPLRGCAARATQARHRNRDPLWNSARKTQGRNAVRRRRSAARVQRVSRRTRQQRQGTQDPMREAPTPTTSVETIRKALLGYRVMAWATGIWLIALCYEMVLKYGFNNDSLSWIAIVHGWVYFVY